MPNRADAHIHLFRAGFVATLPETCRRQKPDELTLYQALSEQYDVQQALVVGFEGEAWAAENNQYLAEVVPTHAWVKPVAFVPNPAQVTVSILEQWQKLGFVGLSIYLFSDEIAATLSQVADEVWAWLSQQRWLISLNSRGPYWTAWLQVLERYPELRLIISHLGLPPAVEHPLNGKEVSKALQTVLALSQFSGVHVKLSGFYALTQPGYNYPHQAAWPYVEALLAAFGPTRLLWGSDFSPSMECLSFPQTFGLFAAMPFLTATDIEGIEGVNLQALLADITKNR
jgi:L-fuconolactonase